MGWRALAVDKFVPAGPASQAGDAVSKQILYSAVVTGATSLFPKLIGLVREATVATLFGVSGQLDAYFIAFTLIGLPSAIVLQALQTATIPALVPSRERRQGSQRELLAGICTVALLAMALLLVPLAVFLPQLVDWLGAGLDLESRAQIAHLFYWFIPYYFLSALNLLGYGALQARKAFLRNGLLPALIPAAGLAVLLVLHAEPGAVVLVWGLALGALLEFVVLNAQLRKRYGLSLLPGRPVFAGDHRPILSQFALLLPATLVMALWPVIDQVLASAWGSGAITALNYGAKFPAVISGLMVAALGAAALPHFVGMVASLDGRQCVQALDRLTALVLAVSLLVSAVLIAGSSPITSLLFERGAFGEQAIQAVVPIQQAYLLQLPGSLVGIVAVRLHVALGHARTLLAVTICTVAFYAIAASVLSNVFQLPGIAFATALTSGLNALVFYWLLRRHFRRAPNLALQEPP